MNCQCSTFLALPKSERNQNDHRFSRPFVDDVRILRTEINDISSYHPHSTSTYYVCSLFFVVCSCGCLFVLKMCLHVTVQFFNFVMFE